MNSLVESSARMFGDFMSINTNENEFDDSMALRKLFSELEKGESSARKDGWIALDNANVLSMASNSNNIDKSEVNRDMKSENNKCNIYEQIFQKGVQHGKEIAEKERKRADSERKRADELKEEIKKLKKLLKKNHISF